MCVYRGIALQRALQVLSRPTVCLVGDSIAEADHLNPQFFIARPFLHSSQLPCTVQYAATTQVSVPQSQYSMCNYAIRGRSGVIGSLDGIDAKVTQPAFFHSQR